MYDGVDFTYLEYDNTKTMWEYEMTYFIKKTWSEYDACVLLFMGLGVSQKRRGQVQIPES